MKIGTIGLSALLLAAVAVPLAVPALAQNVDAVKARQAAMKTIGKSAKTAGGYIKGETEFDAAKATELFVTMKDSAVTFSKNFPEDSKTGNDTEASPAIWEKPDEFKAKLAKFEGDLDAAIAAKPATLDAFKASFGTVSQNCKSCHQEFRVDK
jgi:cytochrome c556